MWGGVSVKVAPPTGTVVFDYGKQQRFGKLLVGDGCRTVMPCCSSHHISSHLISQVVVVQYRGKPEKGGEGRGCCMCVCLHCTKDAPGYYLCVCVQVYIGLSFPSLLLSLYHHHHHPRKGHNRKCPPLAVNNWGRGCCSFMG